MAWNMENFQERFYIFYDNEIFFGCTVIRQIGFCSAIWRHILHQAFVKFWPY